jgi:hypothetical protein
MSNEQFSTFETPLLGIKIKFPSRYSVNTIMGSLTDLVLEDPDRLFSVIIVKRSVDKQETLEQVFEDFYDDTPEHLGAKSSSLGGLPALKYDYKFVSNDKVLDVLTLKDGTAYTLHCHHLKGKSVPAYMEQIINSFEFTS